MNVNEYAIITNKATAIAFETLTENNYHNDTSIFNAYIAFGLVPYTAPEYDEIWSILNGLKEIDHKNYTQGFLRFEDLEKRSKLDKRLEQIIKKYI